MLCVSILLHWWYFKCTGWSINVGVVYKKIISLLCNLQRISPWHKGEASHLGLCYKQIIFYWPIKTWWQWLGEGFLPPCPLPKEGFTLTALCWASFSRMKHLLLSVCMNPHWQVLTMIIVNEVQSIYATYHATSLTAAHHMDVQAGYSR